MAREQTYRNHAKLVPAFHFFVLPVLLVNIVWTTRAAWLAPGVETVLGLLVAIVLMLLGLFARTFALKVQDRVIRLEMQLRLRELLPAELQPRIDDFTLEQLIALRFASDAELPELAATVLRENLKQREAIKKLIKDWKADHCRA